MARLFVPYGEPNSERITSDRSWICPVGVYMISVASGKGAMGTDAYVYYQEAYYETVTTYNYYRNSGGWSESSQPATFKFGTTPADYCTGLIPLPNNPTFSHTENCYTFEDASYPVQQPATNGDSTTAFGKTFPGSYGATPVQPTVFNNIVVEPGKAYPMHVPNGGELIITYTR